MTHVNRHLVDVDALLDTELGNVDIKCGIENTDNLGLTDDSAVALSEVVDEDAEEQVRRLLLSKAGRVLLAVGGASIN